MQDKKKPAVNPETVKDEAQIQKELDKKAQEELWTRYFGIEKGIYEQILSNPAEEVKGTVKELAEKYNGNLTISADEDVFHVNILMPIAL